MPEMRWEFTLGNAINLAALVAAVALAWGVMAERSEATQHKVRVVETSTAQLETRVRALENSQARADERLSSILQVLGRIEARLEKFDKN